MKKSKKIFKKSRTTSNSARQVPEDYGSKGMYGGEGGRYAAGGYTSSVGMQARNVFQGPGKEGRFGNTGSGGRRQSEADN